MITDVYKFSRGPKYQYVDGDIDIIRSIGFHLYQLASLLVNVSVPVFSLVLVADSVEPCAIPLIFDNDRQIELCCLYNTF